ncbi:MAG: hypothetical protein JWM04_1746, partial [Verrucomicrobiales bacterium]|nr:hypothetical protein [Verrucomicrobiales bacterium]
AQKIRSSANAESEIIQAQARAKASGLRGQADAEASKSLTILNQNPELADFLMKITALELTLSKRATLILDQRTPPFDLLNGTSALPSSKTK